MKMSTRFSAKAIGNSMYPLLQNEDIVEYVQTPFSDIRFNDIVLTYVEDKLITHRVIYKTKKTCITRGDNNAAADPPLRGERILGKVVRFKRKGRWHSICDIYLIQSALYLHEIKKLEALLQTNKIPHVFLKGVLVSLHYEGSIPQRIYADCDILVSREHYKIIQKIFIRLGFTLQKKSPHAFNRKKLEDQPEVSYAKTVNGIPVVFDVHFEPVFLMRQFEGTNSLYPERLLKQLGNEIIRTSKRRNLKGYIYPLCSFPHQILYLALHIFHHNFTDGVRYQFLDTIIRTSSLSFRSPIGGEKSRNAKRFGNWEELAAIIKEYRLEGYLYLVFVILKKYYKTPIPPSFFRAIAPSRFALYVIHHIAQRVDIFSQNNQVQERIERMIFVFFLSPEPFIKKALLFFHPETIQIGIKLITSCFAPHLSPPTHGK